MRPIRREHYTRNRIRARVLPYLEKEVNDQAVRHMAQTIGEMRSLAAYVGQETERFFHLCVRKEAGGELVIREGGLPEGAGGASLLRAP